MTEAEWLTEELLDNLLSAYAGNLLLRETRLLVAACCRSAWHLITDERCRRAVELAEQFAGLQVSLQSLAVRSNEATNAWEAAVNALTRAETSAASSDRIRELTIAFDQAKIASTILTVLVDLGFTIDVLDSVTGLVTHSAITPDQWGTAEGDATALQAGDAERSRQRQYVRDIFGNPFRPVTLDPAWRTANVVGIAQSIYEDRAFDRMPILADALEDAGCTQTELLQHCREPGEHVRGCWLLDLVLAKE